LERNICQQSPQISWILQEKSRMTEKLELAEEVHEAIKSYCERGDALAENKQYEAAIREYNQAWALIPSPKNVWKAATWVLAAIVDAAYLGGFEVTARKAIEYAMTCPGAIGNPFLHLRFGQILFDEEEADQAADELMRAYMGGGAEIFENEDEKYLNFLKEKAII
jgi:tetratricopeptide (TPR) repeat protein